MNALALWTPAIRWFPPALLSFLLVAIAIFLIQVLLLRWIFKVYTIVEYLSKIEQEISELNSQNKDIRTLLTSIDDGLNRTKKDAEALSKRIK